MVCGEGIRCGGVARRGPGWLLLMVLERGVVVHERYFVQASMWVPLKFKIPGIECRVASLAIALPKWVVSEAGAATSATMDLQANRDTHTQIPRPPGPLALRLLSSHVGLRNRHRVGTAETLVGMIIPHPPLQGVVSCSFAFSSPQISTHTYTHKTRYSL